jgi:hypothetical protein
MMTRWGQGHETMKMVDSNFESKNFFSRASCDSAGSTLLSFFFQIAK